MSDWIRDSLFILAALFLVLLNGFFVAAEFALVKIHTGRLEELVNRRLELELDAPDVDTLSGFLVAKAGRLLEAGDEVDLGGATARILEADGSRALRVEITIDAPTPDEAGGEGG